MLVPTWWAWSACDSRGAGGWARPTGLAGYTQLSSGNNHVSAHQPPRGDAPVVP